MFIRTNVCNLNYKKKIWSDNYKNCDYRPSSSVDLERIASNN